jgi:uncharacterized OsmC-like protein
MTTNEREQVNADALRGTVAAVTDDRRLGKVEFTVRGQWDGRLRLESTTGPLSQAGADQGQRSGRFTMKSDEPNELLGSDTAPSPAEYVLQALAGCYTVTLAANAAARGIAIDSVQLGLQADIDLAGFLGIDDAVRPVGQAIRVDITLDSDATREQEEELIRVVTQRSPIRDTLVAGTTIETILL